MLIAMGIVMLAMVLSYLALVFWFANWYADTDAQ